MILRAFLIHHSPPTMWQAVRTTLCIALRLPVVLFPNQAVMHAAAAMYRRCSRLSPLYPSLQRTVIKGLTCYAQFGQCEYTLSVLSHLDSQNRVFVCFGGHSKGLPVTKQRLYHWIVDAIVLVYASAGVQCPICVRAHSIRGMSSWDPTVWTSLPCSCGYYLLNATCFPSSGGKGL